MQRLRNYIYIATPIIIGKKEAPAEDFPDFAISLLAVESINVLPSFSAILHAAPTTISPIAESSFRERPLFVLLEKPRYRTDSPVVCERACTRWSDEDGVYSMYECLVRVLYACVCAKEGERMKREGRSEKERLWGRAVGSAREKETDGIGGEGRTRRTKRDALLARMGRCHGNLGSFHPLAMSSVRTRELE